MFIAQVKDAVKIFEGKFPGITGIFSFDNAPSHKKFADDALNASSVNVYQRETASLKGWFVGGKGIKNGLT